MIICTKTRKPVRKFDVSRHLENNEVFQKFTKPDRMIRSFCVSLKTSTIFMIINRNHPHLVIFNYLSMKVVQWMKLHPPIERSTHAAVSCILLKTDVDDFLFFIYQIRSKITAKIESCYKILHLDPSKQIYIDSSLQQFNSSHRLTKVK